MPHAEDHLLGVRVRAVLDKPNGPKFGEWSPWHSTCEGRFKDQLSYTAPPYVRQGEAHYWSGAAPWRDEVYGGDEPYERDYEDGVATPGPGAYNTPSFLLFGNQLPFKQGPSSSFTSNVRRDGSVRTKQAAIGYKHHMHERLQSNEPPMPRPGTAPHSMNPAERRRALQVRKFQPDDEPQKKPWR